MPNDADAEEPASCGLSHSTLARALERQPLFENKTWRLSPQPWPLTAGQVAELEQIGQACHEFYQGIDLLYRRSTEGKNLLRNKELTAPWVAGYLDRGKPLRLTEHGRLPEFRGDTPVVIRPDLLLTEDGWALTEMDSVPGGIGLTAFLNGLYGSGGFEMVGGDADTMLLAFYQTLKDLAPDIDDPTIVIVVSDEAAVYRPEFEWAAGRLRDYQLPVYVRHPDEIMPMGGSLSIPVNGNPRPVDIIYRFFELFDLGNIRTAQGIMDAVESGEVVLTPPMKTYQEEKLNLALLHHHVLADFWRETLSRRAYKTLMRIVPRSWVVDPVELPPNAVLDAPYVAGRPIRRWEELGESSQKDRNLILKASGFHETAWGARSVVYGSDHSREEWLEAIETAIDMADETLHILQEYRKPMRLRHPVYTHDDFLTEPMEGRLRLCPFYFIREGEAHLSGTLATFCPADKKIIHGMRDAAMLPGALVESR